VAQSGRLHSLRSLDSQESALDTARLAAVLDEMTDAVMVVNGEGEIVFANRAFRSRGGAAVPHLPLHDESGKLVGDADRPRARAARGESFELHFTVALPNGERRWVEATGRPLPVEAGGGGLVVFHDVTDRSLRELQGTFVAMLGHELRTPLTALSGYIELLIRQLGRMDPPNETATRYADRALGQVRRFGTLIDELFDANRLRTGRVEFNLAPVPLRPIVEEATAMAEPLADGRSIIVDPGRAALVVRGDSERLEQVVLNLLNNAIRHAPESEWIEVRLRRRGRFGEVTVQDYGPGLSTTDLERLRQPLDELSAAFSPKRGSGLGLGLYIARSIVEAHRGLFEVDSVPGQGAAFRVAIPLA
jgi:signal transduction histidine kinase